MKLLDASSDNDDGDGMDAYTLRYLLFFIRDEACLEVTKSELIGKCFVVLPVSFDTLLQ